MELFDGDAGVGVSFVLRSEDQAEICQLRTALQSLIDKGAMLPEVDHNLMVGDKEKFQLFLLLPKKPNPEPVSESEPEK